MLFQRGHRLRPAEAHPAQRLHRLDVVLDSWRRVLDDLLLRERRHRRRVMVFLLPPKREADLQARNDPRQSVDQLYVE